MGRVAHLVLACASLASAATSLSNRNGTGTGTGTGTPRAFAVSGTPSASAASSVPSSLLIDTSVPPSSSSSEVLIIDTNPPPSPPGATSSSSEVLTIDTNPPPSTPGTTSTSSGGLLIDTNPPPSPPAVTSSSSEGLIIDTSPPPTITASSNNSATTGSGYSYAQSCNDARIAWTQAAYSWHGTSYYTTTGFGVQMTASIQNLSASACSTLCDNYPRCAGSPSRTEYYLTFPYTYTTYAGAFTQKDPDCSISPSDCVSLVSSYFSVVDPIESSISSLEQAGQSIPYGSFYSALPVDIPQCTTDATWTWTESLRGLGQFKKRAVGPTPLKRAAAPMPTITQPPRPRMTDVLKDKGPELHRRANTIDPCKSCLLDADALELLYWPVTRVGGLCDANRTYITGQPTISGKPNTKVWSGITLTSPTVYLSFKNLNVFSCPRSGTQEVLAIQPDQLSSERFPMQSVYPFNFDDLNTPVPLDAYKGQAMCWATWNGLSHDECATIWDDYNPWISLPTSMVLGMDPAWAGCTAVGLDLPVYDPPIPLTTAGALEGTTTTEDPQPEPTPAEPSQTAADPAPPPTDTAVPVPVPVQSSDPDPPSNSDPPSGDPSNNDPSSDPNPADPTSNPSDPGSGGGLGPIISQIVSLISGGSPPQATSNPDPQDPGSNNNDPAPGQSDPAPAPAPIATVGTQVISADPSDPSGVIIGGAPLAPGQVTTIGDTPVSVAPGAVVVGGGQGGAAPSTIAIPTPAPAAVGGGSSAPVATVGGQIVAPDPAQPGHVIVGGQTLPPGAETIIAGTPVSVASGAVVVAGSTIALPPVVPAAATMTTINGQPVVVDPSDPGAVVVNGQTIHAGDPGLTISGTPISLGAGSIILGTQTIPLTSPTQVTIAGQTYTLTPGQPLVISGTTILPGGPAATISGTPISLAAGGLIIAGSSTLALPTAAASAPAQGALITLGGAAHTASEGANGAVVIDGTTLTPGGPAATISGTVVSAAADGLVVGGRTVAYSGPAATEALVTAADGAVLTATRLADGTVRVGGQVLSVGGPAVTVDGVVLSLGPQGVVMGTAAAGGTAFGGTRTVGWVTLTGTGGFGSLIWDGLGAGSTSGSKGSGSGSKTKSGSSASSDSSSSSSSSSTDGLGSAAGTQTGAAAAETSKNGSAEMVRLSGVMGLVGVLMLMAVVVL